MRANGLYQLEYRIQRPDSNTAAWVWEQSIAETDADGTVKGFVGTITDISDRKQAEIALQNLIEGTAATTGQDFFPALVTYMAQGLNVSYAFVNEVVDGQLYSLAFWAHGSLQPTFSCTLEHTPCGRTLRYGKFSCKDSIQHQFPNNLNLAALEAESYLGIILRDSQGRGIGTLCIIDTKPLKDVQRAENLLRVFAARASAELERQRATTLLEQLNQELEAKVEERTAELRASRAYYQGIIADQTELICRFLPDGSLTFVNDAYCNFVGKSPAELLGNTFTTFLPGEDTKIAWRNINSLSADQPVGLCEHQAIASDGSIRWQQWTDRALFDPEGNFIEFQAVGRDITALKAAEAAIQRHLNTIEASIDGLSILRDGRHIYLNQSQLDMFGYTDASELLGHSEDAIYSRRGLSDLTQEIQSHLTQHGFWRGEAVGQRRDTTLFPIELSLTLTPTGDIIRVCRDVSDRKAAEEQIRQYAAQLEASNRELEAFAYSVSHDLRAPLRAIDGFSRALLEDYGEAFDEEGQDYFERIRKNVARMGMLIDDLLNLSRVTRSEICYATVNLSVLARELIRELQASEPERQVEVTIAPEICVSADATLMRVVLMNLLHNAWKFTSHHSTACLEFGIIDPGGQPTYFVRDDGAGFDMAYSKKLFGVFQRLHSTHEFPGTGIGLAIVQRAIHRHGGRVWAEGTVEQGATFYFTIPQTAISTLGV